MHRPITRRTLLAGIAGVSGAAALHLPGFAAPRPKGDREMAIAITETPDVDFATGFALAVAAGMDRCPISFLWRDLETGPGLYDDTFPDILNIFFPAAGMPVDLALAPIATNQRITPTDLEGLAWDDDLLIDRYLAWMEHILTRTMDADLRSLLIGIEVDGLLAADAGAWSAYERLVAAAAVRARQLRPGIEVGVEGMYAGRIGPSAAFFPLVDKHCDFTAVSDYPMDGQFRGLDPTVAVRDHFATMAAISPDRPVSFVEWGYPSAGVNDSSERQQARFIAETFAAWDEFAEAIPSVTFSWITDITAQAVAEYETFYELEDEAFAGYLGSIGLRTSAGRDKLAWTVLVEEAAARGW